MACNTCTPTKSIPVCTDLLTLGTIAPDTDVYIFVLNNTTGYLHSQSSTSDNSGTLKLNMSKPDPAFYNADSNYELWATLKNTSPSDIIDIAIDEQNYQCFSLSFNRIYDEDDANVSYEQIELEIL